MKKTVIRLVSVLCLVIALTGCGSLKKSESTVSDSTIKKENTYTGKTEVAAYLHKYKKLPSNYITKAEAMKLGWVSSKGNLAQVASGKSIGGSRFGNYEKKLPKDSYQECDIDYHGGRRNAKRLVYSTSGRIYYTQDHYKTFEKLYEKGN